tara:strand:- start:226 stop:1407 length:1182 start_codon:yes stop_codon:yes gene_type:complete
LKLHSLFYLIGFLYCSFTGQSQSYSLSEAAEISIITVGPGQNLYDKFGHTAFRVVDPANQIDWAYNYGTYDFNTPNFYTKFAQGKLLYELSVWPFDGFMNLYKQENRWVKEQRLNLTTNEKTALFRYLQNNALPENKKYLYDFFYDNCATKIRDILVEVLNNVTYTDDFVKDPMTFRQLIQKNVPANSWGSLGMDVAIGAVTDQQATAWEHQFLPQYVFEAASVATINHNGKMEPLVKETETLFQNNPTQNSTSFFVSPLFVFGLLALLILFITWRDYKNVQRSRYLDGTIFLVTGAIGVILLLLWFATDHSSTANNYNVLWAFPLSLFFAFGICKKVPKSWMQRYVVLLLLMLLLIGLHAITGVQGFAIGLLPLFIALFIRYMYVYSYLKKS